MLTSTQSHRRHRSGCWTWPQNCTTASTSCNSKTKIRMQRSTFILSISNIRKPLSWGHRAKFDPKLSATTLTPSITSGKRTLLHTLATARHMGRERLIHAVFRWPAHLSKQGSQHCPGSSSSVTGQEWYSGENLHPGEEDRTAVRLRYCHGAARLSHG
jgi:hypothetical protein